MIAGPSPVVLKVGGSLFDAPDLPGRLSALIAQFGNRPLALIAGGGAAVDVVRDRDRQYGLGESTSHWLALRAMRHNDSLLGRLVPRTRVVEHWEALASVWSQGLIPILALEPLLRAAAANGEQLPPESWNVTSDSLAAWVAARLQARLVLVKSIGCPAGSRLDGALQGAVDKHFPLASQSLASICWVNLRDPRPILMHWLSSDAAAKPTRPGGAPPDA